MSALTELETLEAFQSTNQNNAQQQQPLQNESTNNDDWLERVFVALFVFICFTIASWIVPIILKYILFKLCGLQEMHQAASGVHIYRNIRDVCGRMSNCAAGKELWETGNIEIPGCHRGKNKPSHSKVTLAPLMNKMYLHDRRLTERQVCELQGCPYDDLGELFSGRVRAYYVTFWTMIVGMTIFLIGIILAMHILQVHIYTLLASLGLLALLATMLIRDTASNFISGLCIMKNNLLESGDYVSVAGRCGWVCIVKSTHTTLYSKCKKKLDENCVVRMEFVEVPNNFFFSTPFEIMCKGWPHT
jgi:small-conductance mechanosensitive channel